MRSKFYDASSPLLWSSIPLWKDITSFFRFFFLQGFDIVTYLRVVTSDGSIFCSFVLGKARLVTIKAVSIPRLELVAATLAVKVNFTLRLEFSNAISKSIFELTH